jgi:hypothetical protein
MARRQEVSDRERRTAVYWEKRAKYFETFRGSAKGVAGLGMDAWGAGGSALNVLVREDEYFFLWPKRRE